MGTDQRPILTSCALAEDEAEGRFATNNALDRSTREMTVLAYDCPLLGVSYVQDAASSGGAGTADELAKLADLKAQGSSPTPSSSKRRPSCSPDRESADE